MPRGSRPGERRGGRQLGTPNKKTLLKNAALAAAAANPDISPRDFLTNVMREARLPLALRIDTAAAALPFFHAKPKTTRQIRDAGNQTWTLVANAEDRISGPACRGPGIELFAKPKPKAVGGAPDPVVSPLQFLLNVMADPATPPHLRIRAARLAAPYRHARASGDVSAGPKNNIITTDEYGFQVDQASARELRDLVLRQYILAYHHRGEASGLQYPIEKLCKLLPSCPPGYGGKEAYSDKSRVLGYCAERILQKAPLNLSMTQDAEEIHVVFRMKTYERTQYDLQSGQTTSEVHRPDHMRPDHLCVQISTAVFHRLADREKIS